MTLTTVVWVRRNTMLSRGVEISLTEQTGLSWKKYVAEGEFNRVLQDAGKLAEENARLERLTKTLSNSLESYRTMVVALYRALLDEGIEVLRRVALKALTTP